MKLPKVSLVILSYNGRHITPMILDSIKHLKYPANKLETIVVDNGSTDGSASFFKEKYPFIKLVQLPKNLGYGGINAGVNQSTGEYCFLLNNDMEIHPDCIREILEVFNEHPEAVIAAPALYDLRTRKLLYTHKYVSRNFYNSSDYHSNFTDLDDISATEEAYTGVSFIKTKFAKSLIFVVDPDYFLYGDDVDLCYRIRLQGYTIYRSRKAILYHEGCATTTAVFKNAFLTYHNEKNLFQTYLKNLEIKNVITWFPYFAGFRLLNIFKSVFTFDIKNILALVRAWSWNVSNLRKTLKKRKHIQSTRKVTDKQIFQKIGNELKVIKYLLINK